MIPKIGQFLAVHSHGFIPESIQFFETIQEIRECDLNKNELIINHIAQIINDEKGELCVYEMNAKGCEVTRWEDSRYFRNEVTYFILELTIPFTPWEYLNYQIAVQKDKGKGYDFIGILSQLIFNLTGLWFGRSGKDAQARFYCSEQAATRINEQKPFMFEKPWKVNPQMFFEDKYINVVSSNFKTV